MKRKRRKPPVSPQLAAQMDSEAILMRYMMTADERAAVERAKKAASAAYAASDENKQALQELGLPQTLYGFPVVVEKPKRSPSRN